MYKVESIAPRYDALIIGSGIAGLLLADLLSKQGMQVIVACKGKLSDSNTSMAQGGLAAVTGANPLDAPSLHLADTMKSGAGLSDEAVARMMVSRGRELVELLTNYNVNFEKKNGTFDMALEGGHSRARVLHNKDASGKAISSGLIASVVCDANITIVEHAFALDLLMENGACVGASILIKGVATAIHASHTVLATGGLGRVFSRTTNPEVATGDGIAMAYRAGAELIDMEFVQFHPTALSIPGKPADLVSEAVRGAGATLLDRDGQRFAFRFHKDGELATRDIVARAIFATMMESQSEHVWLDMRPIGTAAMVDKFPNIVQKCIDSGFDPTVSPVPIAPAAHYFMGGISTDITGGTTLPNLYAIGECASNGLHGANRLASNSLLEGGVMAMQLSERLGRLELSKDSDSRVIGIDEAQFDNAQYNYTVFDSATVDNTKLGTTVFESRGESARHPLSREALAKAAFECIGLERSGEKLKRILNMFDPKQFNRFVEPDQPKAELANLELLTWLIAKSALDREETRGGHCRIEFPQTNDAAFLKRHWITSQNEGWRSTKPLHLLKNTTVAVANF